MSGHLGNLIDLHVTKRHEVFKQIVWNILKLIVWQIPKVTKKEFFIEVWINIFALCSRDTLVRVCCVTCRQKSSEHIRCYSCSILYRWIHNNQSPLCIFIGWDQCVIIVHTHSAQSTSLDSVMCLSKMLFFWVGVLV